jgi:hypothetical protein
VPGDFCFFSSCARSSDLFFSIFFHLLYPLLFKIHGPASKISFFPGKSNLFPKKEKSREKISKLEYDVQRLTNEDEKENKIQKLEEELAKFCPSEPVEEGKGREEGRRRER